MVAGLFAAHGLWYGTTRKISAGNPKGNFEGRAVGSVLDRHYGAIVSTAVEAKPKPGIEREIVVAIRADGYRDGPWFWKGSVMYWRAFIDLDPHWVTVRRSAEDIFRSNKRLQKIHLDVARSVEEHARVLDLMEFLHDARRIDSQKLVDRDYEQITRVFAGCGLVFNASLADDWIDPNLWHFNYERTTSRIAR